MDLLAYLRILRRRWALILGMTLLGIALGAGSALAIPSGGDSDRFYKATHLMFLDTTNENSGSSAFTNLDQIAVLATTGETPERVGRKLGEDGRALAEHVIVSTNSVSSTLDITAASASAREAEEIADTFAEELITNLNEKDQERYDAKRDRIVTRLDELQTEINTFDAQVAGGGGDLVKAQRDGLVNQYRLTYEQFQQLAQEGSPITLLSTLEEATPVPIDSSEYDERLELGRLGENIRQVGSSTGASEDEPIASSSSSLGGPVPRGVFGGFLGLLLGLGIAIAKEHLDQRLHTREEVEQRYGVPVLADVPRLPKQQRHREQVLSYTEPLSRTAEAHRAVRSALLFQQLTRQTTGRNGDGAATAASTASFVAPDDGAKGNPLVVLVTSALPNEGKTTTTSNLAAVFAESGASVLAVNCDFRRPTLHRYLGAEHAPRRVQESNIPGVALVSGVVADPAANPAQIIAAQRQVVATARDRFDVIILDTAPLLTTNDAIEIVPVVDLVLLVARPGVTTADAAERTRTLLERVDAPIAGVVFIGDESVSNDPYYYYSQASGAPAAASTRAASADSDAGSESGRLTAAAQAEVAAEDDADSLAWASEAGAGLAPADSAVDGTGDNDPTEEIAAIATVGDDTDPELDSKPSRRKRHLRRTN